jgi:hypothetical protein
VLVAAITLPEAVASNEAATSETSM